MVVETFLLNIIIYNFLSFIHEYWEGSLWQWSYGSWIYNYLCNQSLSPLMWVRILIKAMCTTLFDKICQWLATGLWFSLSSSVSSTNKTDRHDITEILLKVALNTIKQTNEYWDFITSNCHQNGLLQFVNINLEQIKTLVFICVAQYITWTSPNMCIDGVSEVH